MVSIIYERNLICTEVYTIHSVFASSISIFVDFIYFLHIFIGYIA